MENTDLEAALQRVRQAIKQHVGIYPDETPDTLPLVDAWLQQQEDPSERDAGIYFGEVVRRALDGRWVHADNDPSFLESRIELINCPLYFYPIGMTAETIAQCESPKYDGTFSTSPDLQEALEEYLQHAAPMLEETYYSLTGRWEILSMVADWLVNYVAQRRIQSN